MNAQKTNWKEVKPEYRESNPKLDFYKGDTYVSSSNWYRNVSHARAHNPTLHVKKSRG